MSAAELIETVPARALSSGLPAGYAVTVGVATCATLAALTSRRAGGPLGPVRYIAAFVVNEQPVLAGYWLGAATLLAAAQGDLRGPAAWTVAAVAAFMAAALIMLAVRALPSTSVIDKALDDGIGTGWRDGVGGGSSSAWTPRSERARLLWPLHGASS